MSKVLSLEKIVHPHRSTRFTFYISELVQKKGKQYPSEQMVGTVLRAYFLLRHIISWIYMRLLQFYYSYLRTWISWKCIQKDLPVVHHHHIPEGHHCCLKNRSRTAFKWLCHRSKPQKWGGKTSRECKNEGFHPWSHSQQSHRSCWANIPAAHRSHTAECHYHVWCWQHCKRLQADVNTAPCELWFRILLSHES